MSNFLSVNGIRASHGTITIPMWGAWVADVALATPDTLTPAVTLEIGDLSLKGTVVRQAAFAGTTTARIVAGAAGWRKELPARGYSLDAGVKLSDVLLDAAKETGESIAIAEDRTLGVLFAREAAKAEELLHLLLDGEWWVDNAGVTQTGARASSPIVTPFTAVSRSGSRGEVEIATENIAAWQPARTFTTNTLPEALTISSVTIDADESGKLRLRVLPVDDEKERLRSYFRALVARELARVNYSGTWEYTVAPSTGLPGTKKTIDCIPTDPRMPQLTNVPLVGMGAVTPPLTGTSCRIRFVNSDPSRPECISLGGSTEHLMTTEATALLIYNTLVALMASAGGGPLVAAVLQPLLGTAVLTALTAQGVPAPPGTVAQVALAAAQTPTFAAGAVPATTSAFFAPAIAAMSNKTLDVTGLFPGIGVPSGD